MPVYAVKMMPTAIIRKTRVKLQEKLGRRMLECIINYSPLAQRISGRFARICLIAINVPAALARCQGRVVPYVLMDVTSRCTLNCKECTHLIPALKRSGAAADADMESMLADIDALMARIDRCLVFRLMGGEPFLRKDIHLLVRKLAEQEKIKHVQIVTNGTLIPCEEALASLAHRKVSVAISDYGVLSTRKDELTRILKERGIRFKIHPNSGKWHETKGLFSRGYTDGQMREVFFHCLEGRCKSLHGGRLWLCPRAQYGQMLGLVPENALEYIDLPGCGADEFWERLSCMYESPEGLTTCHYCSGHNPNAHTVPAAEQEL